MLTLEPDRENTQDPLEAWARATLILGVAGIAVTTGMRALFQLGIGPVPYELPSNGRVAVLIGLASAMGAAVLVWASRTEDAKFRLSNFVAPLAVLILVLDMLRGAYKRADSLSELNTPFAPLAAVERRAALRPDHAASQLALGAAYYRIGRYADATAPLERAMKLSGGVPDVRPIPRADTSRIKRPAPHLTLNSRAAILDALTRAHLAPEAAALGYYRQAFQLGDHSKRVTLPLLQLLWKERRFDEIGDVTGHFRTPPYLDAEQSELGMRAYHLRNAIRVARAVSHPSLPPGSVQRLERLQARLRMDSSNTAARSQLMDARLAAAESKLADTTIVAIVGTMKAPSPEPYAAERFEAAVAHARNAVALAPREATYLAKLGLALTLADHVPAADSAFAAALIADGVFLAADRSYTWVAVFPRAGVNRPALTIPPARHP